MQNSLDTIAIASDALNLSKESQIDAFAAAADFSSVAREMQDYMALNES